MAEGGAKPNPLAFLKPADGPSINDYETRQRCGSGSFGTVFQSVELATGNIYAVKECYKRTLEKRSITHLAMREREAMMKMDHPFVIKLHQSFQDRLCLYFVMDYMPNGTLQDQLEIHGHFRNDVTRFYSAEIIMALEYLRTLKIVHRDLKWENILLDKDWHAKLSDFGYCVTLENPEVGSLKSRPRTKSQRNSYVGTDPYYAPEIIDNKHVTYGTDLWCLGCMLYECHTGKYAFESGDENFKYIRAGTFQTFPDGSDPYLMDLVSKLLVPDPYQRLGIKDMDKIKNHDFYGTEDVEDWKTLQTITPPTFDPPKEAERSSFDMIEGSGRFGASGSGAKPGSSEPPIPDPPAEMDWNDMDSPSRNNTPVPVVKVKKCCIIM